MEIEINIYHKQKKLFNPHEHQPRIFVYGAGSIGSHTLIGLAKVGFKNITVFDFDKVEKDNLPAQFYSIGYSNDSKVAEISRMAEFMTGTRINAVLDKITEEFSPIVEMNSIHILAFDNIEARKNIFSKLIDFPVYLIDGRIGGFNFEKYTLKMDDAINREHYSKTLEGEFAEQDCGEKCLWAVNSLIASKIIADVIKITQGKEFKYMLKGNLMGDLMIGR